MSLAEKLVSLRKQKGLSQMELAGKLDVSRQAVSRWEVGSSSPSTDNLKILSELYEVPIDYLLSDHVDFFNKCDEDRNFQKREPCGKVKFQRREFAIGLAIVVVVVILATIVSEKLALNQEFERSRPIEDWTQIESTNDIPYTFSIVP